MRYRDNEGSYITAHCSLSLVKKSTASEKKEKRQDNPYETLRSLALGFKAEELEEYMEYEDQVYLAVVDISTADGTATLICVIDGSVSLYFSNGGGVIGIGHAYEEVEQEGMSLLAGASEITHLLPIASDLDLPKNELTAVHLLTKDGVYKAEFDMYDDQNSEEHIQYLNYLIQRVLTAIRESGALDDRPSDSDETDE